jgi:hypothetical protein
VGILGVAGIDVVEKQGGIDGNLNLLRQRLLGTVIRRKGKLCQCCCSYEVQRELVSWIVGTGYSSKT